MTEPKTPGFIREGRLKAKKTTGRLGKRAALAQLSRDFAKSGDLADLAACVVCVDAEAYSVDFDHGALISIEAAAFMKAGRFAPADFHIFRQDLLGRAYFRVFERVRASLADQLKPTPVDLGAPAQRILLITPQMLSLQHAPTMRMCMIARRLMKDAGKQVQLVNPAAWPLKPQGTFSPPWAAAKISHDGAAQLAYEDVELPFFSIGEPADISGRIARVLQVARAFKPDVVINQGEFNLPGELLSCIHPSVFLPTTSGEPITRAHVLADFAGTNGSPLFDHVGVHGFMPEIRHFRLDGAPPSKTQSQTRAEHGLPEDAFLIVVAGSRLKVEMTEDFSNVLADVLDAAPRAHLVTVSREAPLRGRLAKMSERVTQLELLDDISSFLELCDCYVNPPRIGGGRTAYLAAMETVPVLCDPHGDAAMGIGVEHALPDAAAIRDAAIAMANDPQEQARWIERAEAIKDAICARSQGFDTLLACLDDSRRVFNDACAGRPLAAAE